VTKTRLLGALRDAVIGGVAVLGLLMIFDYFRDDSPEWGFYLPFVGAYTAASFLFLAIRRRSEARGGRSANDT
jgi:hypothetical protein